MSGQANGNADRQARGLERRNPSMGKGRTVCIRECLIVPLNPSIRGKRSGPVAMTMGLLFACPSMRLRARPSAQDRSGVNRDKWRDGSTDHLETRKGSILATGFATDGKGTFLTASPGRVEVVARAPLSG